MCECVFHFTDPGESELSMAGLGMMVERRFQALYITLFEAASLSNIKYMAFAAFPMVAVIDKINKLMWALFLPYLLPGAVFSVACLRVCKRPWKTP